MDKQERWMLRIPRNIEGDRFLARIRKYLNKDTYKVSKHYTGPRPRGTSQTSTLKENATSVRLYIDPKIHDSGWGYQMWLDAMSENTKLKLRLDHAYTELAKAQSALNWREDE